MTHVMIDLETLGTKPGAVLLSIGAVAFDPFTGDMFETYYKSININSSINLGMHVDGDTMAWWMAADRTQSARSAAFAGEELLPVVLGEFTDFLNTVMNPATDGLYLWGHGAAFDPVLLEAAFDHCQLETPWKFYNVRDTRTLFDLARVRVERNEAEHHHALHDAVAQAKAAHLAYVALGIKPEVLH